MKFLELKENALHTKLQDRAKGRPEGEILIRNQGCREEKSSASRSGKWGTEESESGDAARRTSGRPQRPCCQRWPSSDHKWSAGPERVVQRPWDEKDGGNGVFPTRLRAGKMPATPLTTPGPPQDAPVDPAEAGQGSGLEATQTRRQTGRL